MHGLDSLVPLFHTHIRGTRIVVTPQLVVDVLYVPRVEHPDYRGCELLRTVSKDEMISAFYERPSNWGDHQFTPCKAFAKGPKLINMVMTFVLHPLSHYNSIIEPHARFLLSLLEHLTLDFPSNFILSIIDVFRDTDTHDKLIFPSTITQILCHFSIPFPSSDHFSVMYAIDVATVKCSRHSLGHGSWIQQLLPPVQLHFILLHPHLLPPLLRAMCHSGTSWHSCSAWMLALIHSLQSCIR